jgi:hypothetical protein
MQGLEIKICGSIKWVCFVLGPAGILKTLTSSIFGSGSYGERFMAERQSEPNQKTCRLL